MRILIDQRQRDIILTLEEGHFHDLKSVEIKPSKLSESVSAFANASGGEIFVGIREEKVGETKARLWSGFDDIEAANPILQMLNQIAPLADFISTSFLACEGEKGLVLKIEILRNGSITKSTDGATYVRKGAQKLPVNSDEGLERLRLDKGISSYEDYKVQADLDVIENSVVALNFLLGVVPTAEPEPWLRKQRFIVDRNPTVAGTLLFAEEPQALLPKRTAIKIFRYKTSDIVPTRDNLAFDPITMEGWAYKLIYDSVAKTQDIVKERLGEAGQSNYRVPARNPA
ncbi:putative HTH transcriptional regulator [Xanthomonas translucens]